MLFWHCCSYAVNIDWRRCAGQLQQYAREPPRGHRAELDRLAQENADLQQRVDAAERAAAMSSASHAAAAGEELEQLHDEADALRAENAGAPS